MRPVLPFAACRSKYGILQASLFCFALLSQMTRLHEYVSRRGPEAEQSERVLTSRASRRVTVRFSQAAAGTSALEHCCVRP